MKGKVLEEVRAAIVEAFDLAELEMLLRDHFDFKVRDHFPNQGFIKVVHDVVEKFAADGLDVELIAVVAAKKPRKRAVQEIYRKYAAALLDEATRTRVEAEQLALLRRYGVLPDASLQREGRLLQDQLLSPGGPRGFQRMVNDALPELDALAWAARLLKTTRSICRVEVNGQGRGTGFLVAPDLVLTNHHVLRELIDGRRDGRRLAFLFDHFIGSDGTVSDGLLVPARVQWAEWHVDSSPPLAQTEEDRRVPLPSVDRLDHALVRLARPIGDQPASEGSSARGWIPLPAAAPAIEPGMPLAILQHPGARPLKLTFDTRAVLSVNENGTRVRYATNTDKGASGAPCFDVDWNLVALHHFGDPESTPATYNQGIPVSAIRARLERAGHAALLEGDPP